MSNDAPGWASGSALYVFDGGRWSVWQQHEHPADIHGDSQVVGVDGPSLWMWGGNGCWVRWVAGPEAASCPIARTLPNTGPVVDLRMHSETEGWALIHRRDFESPGVVGLDGEDLFGSQKLWTPPDYAPLQVWGDPVGWFALDRTGLFASGGTGGDGRRLDVPAGPYAAMWGTSRDDLWVSTEAGELLHFDGVGWEQRATVSGSPAHLWSRSEERLYFGTARSFGVWTAEGGAEPLLSWTTSQLKLEAIDGDDSSVYLVLTDRRHSTEECGDVFVVEYDGDAFRRL